MEEGINHFKYEMKMVKLLLQMIASAYSGVTIFVRFRKIRSPYDCNSFATLIQVELILYPFPICMRIFCL